MTSATKSRKTHKQSKIWVVLPDIHHPEHCKKSWRAVLDFIRRNKERIAGVILLGDNMNCENFSRHTKGKPRLRTRGGVDRDFRRFRTDILDPIESSVVPGTQLVFFLGNHEDWLEQWLDENPEFENAISYDKCLGLKKKGWQIIDRGESFQVGKGYLIHGDQVGSSINVARKLVELYCATVIMGHVHTASSFTKVSQIKKKDKWMGFTLPTLGTVAPKYAKGRPNAFTNGFGIIEQWSNDFINVYTPIIFEGMFSFAGEMYGG